MFLFDTIKRFLFGDMNTKNPLSFESHKIFQALSFAKNYQIQNLHIESRAKKKMIERFLGIFFDKLTDLVRDVVKDDLPPTKFLDMLYELMPSVYKEAEVCNIPKLFIDKYKLMIEDRLDMIYGGLANIATSTMYAEKHDQINAMLDVLPMLIDFIAIESESLLNQMNGELAKELDGSIFDD